MSSTQKQHSGGCLCGAVRFKVTPEDATYSMCHCGMCRKWTAGPFMSVHCTGDAEFENEEALSWYRGSEWAERGFCSKCGTSLFWRLAADPASMLIVSVEAFDDADSFELHRHIYIDAKPDRYDFADDRPRITEAELMKELGMTP